VKTRKGISVRPGKSMKEDDAASNRLSSCKVAILLAYERPERGYFHFMVHDQVVRYGYA
jgi:hypothetical protein